MKKLSPSDLEKIIKQGNNDNVLNIDEFLRVINKDMKKVLLESQVNAMGLNISLTTTRTRFGGEKFWFICPECKNRCGVLSNNIHFLKYVCRSCIKSIHQ